MIRPESGPARPGPKGLAIRWLEIYRGVSVFLLNFLILLAVCTLVLAGLYGIRDARKQARRTQVYSQHFDLESYLHIDRQTALETGAEFDRMGEAESYRFYPWTVFSERPFAGHWVTVGADGARATKPVEAPNGREPLTVWCFGGSTMFGWGQPNHQTVPSHLQSLLQQALPDRAVEVQNHGHSYWFSSMELNHLMALLRHHPAPDAIVVLDGLNDSRMFLEGRHLPFFTHVAEQAWEEERRRRYAPYDGPWMRLGESFPWLRLARSLRSRLGLDDAPDALDPSLAPEPEPVDVPTALGRYGLNRRAFEALGNELELPLRQYLQPIPGFGPYIGPTQDLGPDIYAFYEQLIADPRHGLTPIHDTLYDLERPFVDQTHYSDEGCRRVAQSIANDLLPLLQTSQGENSGASVEPEPEG